MSVATLLVEDDRPFASLAAAALQREGFNPTVVHSLHGARRHLGTQEFELVLLDRRLPDGDGVSLIREVLQASPGAAVILVTADDDVSSAVEAIRLGAADYLVKPVGLDDLLLKARRASADRHLRERLERVEDELSALHRLVPPLSAAMRTVVATVERVAAGTRAPVLLLGETGVGKEVLARHLHRTGTPAGPFVHLNCAAINEQTAESELFGHERGAFTDAKTSRRGLVEVASEGTLFLDEVGELSGALQAKLLTFLDSGSFRRMGGPDTRRSGARIVAATNRNLAEDVKQGRFRPDLWYRLSAFKIDIPPLRERREDILPIAEAFLRDHLGLAGRRSLGEKARRRLLAYPFAGNVRELRNVIERALVLEPGPELTLDVLETSAAPGPSPGPDDFAVLASEPPVVAAELERRYFRWVLQRLGGKRMEAAAALGVSYPTLAKRLDDPKEP